MSLQDITRAVVAAKVTSERASAELADARKRVEKALVEAYAETGANRFAVNLPGVGKVAEITVKAGLVDVQVDEAALLAVVEAHQPTEVEEVADADALTDPEVLAWLREHRPELVTRRVRQVWRAALLKEATANGGDVIVDKAKGEAVTVAKVVEHPPTGEFQIRFEADGRYLLEQAAAPVVPAADEAEVESLREAAAKLSALEAAGVDNWGGYDHAMQIMRGEYE